MMMMKRKGSYESDYESNYESKRSRRRQRSNSEQRNSRSRSSHRLHGSASTSHLKRHCDHHDNYRHGNSYRNYRHGNSYRNYQLYRESSGTRMYKRSRDGEIRLEQYYKYRSKKMDSLQYDDDRCFRRSRAGSGRHDDNSKHSSKHDSRNNRRKSSSGYIYASSRVRDDEDGHLIYRTGDWLQNRYQVHSLLGEGTFGKCLECYDRKRDCVIALKIIKNIEHYRDAARLEIKVLMEIAKKDPDQKKLCIRLLNSFNHHGHICLAFPKLGKSVFDFMKENLYQPYTMSQVQHISYQLLTAVKFLHSIKLTHTDLKPENILFVDSSYDTIWTDESRREFYLLRKSDIMLIDFGSATFDNERHSTIVSTRHYRAPEVVLELGWSQPCDIWSCGCIIFELFIGNSLFKTHHNRKHLAMMEHILGPLPTQMVKASNKTKYFNNGALLWDTRCLEGTYVQDKCKTLDEYINFGHYNNVHLYDILKQMLTFDPKDRITAANALKHPYFDSITYRSERDCSR